MIEPINYHYHLALKTRAILSDNYDDFKLKDYEVSLLINCLLGLIINVSEKGKISGNIDNDYLSFIPDKIIFLESSSINIDNKNSENNELRFILSNKINLMDMPKAWFLTKIRNGLAHQHIIPIIDENSKWVGVKIFNNTLNYKDFEIEFTIEELRIFAVRVADDFIYKHEHPQGSLRRKK